MSAINPQEHWRPMAVPHVLYLVVKLLRWGGNLWMGRGNNEACWGREYGNVKEGSMWLQWKASLWIYSHFVPRPSCLQTAGIELRRFIVIRQPTAASLSTLSKKSVALDTVHTSGMYTGNYASFQWCGYEMAEDRTGSLAYFQMVPLVYIAAFSLGAFLPSCNIQAQMFSRLVLWWQRNSCC